MTSNPWPVVIDKDRYHGVYSKAFWTAWNLNQVPIGAQAGDSDCQEFWDTNPLCGKGTTPFEAYIDLMNNLLKQNDH